MLIINFFFSVSIYILLKKHRMNKSKFLRDYLKYTKHCHYFPIIQIIKMIPSTINKILQLVNKKEDFYFVCAQIVSSSIMGLLFSTLFCTLPDTKYYIGAQLNKFKLFIYCCYKKNIKMKEDLISNTSYSYNGINKVHTCNNCEECNENNCKEKNFNKEAVGLKLLDNLTLNIIHNNKDKSLSLVSEINSSNRTSKERNSLKNNLKENNKISSNNIENPSDVNNNNNIKMITNKDKKRSTYSQDDSSNIIENPFIGNNLVNKDMNGNKV